MTLNLRASSPGTEILRFVPLFAGAEAEAEAAAAAGTGTEAATEKGVALGRVAEPAAASTASSLLRFTRGAGPVPPAAAPDGGAAAGAPAAGAAAGYERRNKGLVIIKPKNKIINNNAKTYYKQFSITMQFNLNLKEQDLKQALLLLLLLFEETSLLPAALL